MMKMMQTGSAGAVLLAVLVLLAPGGLAVKSNDPNDLVAKNTMTGTSVNVEWNAPTCPVGEPGRTHTYVLTVLGPGDTVFFQKDDFPSTACTDDTQALTSATVESMQRYEEYKITVQSRSDGLETSDGENVKVEIVTDVATCHYETDSSVCECKPGEFHSNGKCQQCAADTYSPTGQECLSCPAGATSSPGSEDIADCSCPLNSVNKDGTCICRKGYGGDATDKSKGCKACQIVGYKEVDWNEPCMVCPLGASIPFHISAATSEDQCRCSDGSQLDALSGECRCSPGYHGSAKEATGCNLCPFGTYKDSVGDKETCDDCSSLIGKGATTEELGAVSADSCTCKFGLVRVGNACIDCPPGADCSKREISDVAALPGYWRNSVNSTTWHECEQPLGLHVCENTVQTDDNGVVSGKVCRKGHQGVLCASCEDNYGKNLGVCTECGTGVYLPSIFFVLAFLFFVLVLYVLTYEGVRRIHFIIYPSSGLKVDYTSTSYLKIFINWLQMVSLALYLKIPKNHSLENMFQIQALGQLHPWNFQTFNCMFPLDFFSKFYYAMLVPVGCVVVAFVFSACLLYSGLLGKRPKLLDLTIMNSQILWFLTYCGTTHTIFEIFSCRDIDVGESVLYADPSVSCNTGEYKQAKLYGTLFVCFYCVGLPLQLISQIWWLKDELFERKVFIRYSFFTLNYKEETYWYETFCMVRKFLLILVVTLIKEDTRRQIFLLSLLSVLYLGIHSYVSPFTKHALNELESHALFTMAFTYNVCVLFQDSSAENDNDFEMTFTWSLILLNFAIAVHCCARIVRSFLSLRGLQKREKGEDRKTPKGVDLAGQADQAEGGLDVFLNDTSKKPAHLPENFSAIMRSSVARAPRYSTAVSNPLVADDL
ncbi:fibronectin type-III domain-containing protein [Chloropicon primus]|uniref:Fibronectin type-III domain-containing protein n=1 Tax=Chloropicon primus TaxID=1764295 RepID=A0A5B8MWB5_9CHLO|nr:hypothetical protein A3770_11p63400 [Chloropicon primus]UPR03035.1 fibronectin type-III domain-containing protein [Chloropicon primus]|eukprot:QDZ23822.1 hypothetical protein A3770_11p63400 [Chloropicon primus]